MNAAEFSGTCSGTALFTPRPPAIVVDKDGKLQSASDEMLYTETGEFEMSGIENTTAPKLTFSRKYVWRLQDGASLQPKISIWFTKPGTEQIDYLFHDLVIESLEEQSKSGTSATIVECSGGHLCVEDYYSSTYTFHLVDSEASEDTLKALSSWKMLHEVRGPTKDQFIETSFTKD